MNNIFTLDVKRWFRTLLLLLFIHSPFINNIVFCVTGRESEFFLPKKEKKGKKKK